LRSQAKEADVSCSLLETIPALTQLPCADREKKELSDGRNIPFFSVCRFRASGNAHVHFRWESSVGKMLIRHSEKKHSENMSVFLLEMPLTNQ
jgi:hypothetical protein